MHRNCSGLILCFFLSACASARPPLVAPLDTSFTLQINQPFEALPNGTHIDYQHGVRVPMGNLDRWTTYCRLYVYNQTRGADYRTAVNVGKLEISAVGMAYESSENLSGPWSPHRQIFWDRRDPPAYFLYQVGMRLTSPDQPDIRSLACYKKWATAPADQYPTLPQIRQALGETIELVPAPGS
jgi:hypothetical protein